MGSRPLPPSSGPSDKPVASRNLMFKMIRKEAEERRKEEKLPASPLSPSPNAPAKACLVPAEKVPVPCLARTGHELQTRKQVLPTPSLRTHQWDAEDRGRGKQGVWPRRAAPLCRQPLHTHLPPNSQESVVSPSAEEPEINR